MRKATEVVNGNEPKVALMTGEITAIEPDLNSEERSTLLVRGYDRSHRMARERKTATHLQVTDSDLASTLAREAGLQASVHTTSVVFPYLLQANQTDWEFLMERARRIGYRLYVEDRTLHFEPPPSAPSETELEWGIHLATFRPRMTTVSQVTEVTVRGWDPQAKNAIVSQASRPAAPWQIGESHNGGALAQSAHSISGKELLVDRPVVNSTDATNVAQAMLNELNAGAIETEGECAGDPEVRAATRVNIKGVGTRFGGKYLVTRALHRYNARGYSTQFWATNGLGSSTVTELLTVPPESGQHNAPRMGLTIGIVTDNKDPENMGRVKVKFPTMGDNVESYWCRLGTIMAGGVRGWATFPEANDEVIVGFLEGDPNYGVVLGAVWNGADPLPLPTAQLVTGGQTIRRIFKTRVGHYILFDDTTDPGGITIQDKTNNNKIIIDTLNNKITVDAAQDIEVTSTNGKISINGPMGVAIKSSSGKVTVDGLTGVDVTATSGKVTASGQQGVDVTAQVGKVAIEGMMGVDAKATGGKVTVNGIMGVDISGEPAPVTVKGLPIMLN